MWWAGPQPRVASGSSATPCAARSAFTSAVGTGRPVAERHELDEARRRAEAPGEPGERAELVLVLAAHHDDVELHRVEAGAERGARARRRSARASRRGPAIRRSLSGSSVSSETLRRETPASRSGAGERPEQRGRSS